MVRQVKPSMPKAGSIFRLLFDGSLALNKIVYHKIAAQNERLFTLFSFVPPGLTELKINGGGDE